MPPSKAAQKLHNTAQNYGTKCTTCCTMKFIVFSLRSSFIIHVRNKVYILIWVCRLVVEKFHKPIKHEVRNSRVTKMSYKNELRNWITQNDVTFPVANSNIFIEILPLELLTRRLNFYFITFELLTRWLNFYFSTFELITRTWKILNYTSSY